MSLNLSPDAAQNLDRQFIQSFFQLETENVQSVKVSERSKEEEKKELPNLIIFR